MTCTTDPDPESGGPAGVRLVHAQRSSAHRSIPFASGIYGEGLAVAHPPNAGWIVPVEPILQPLEREDVWVPGLEIVRQRAT